MSILKTNQITDLGGNNIISSNGSGTFTQTFAANTPSFYGSKSDIQNLSRATFTKITNFTNNEIDTDSAFDGTTFTVPSGKGGKYYLYHKIWADYSTTAGSDGEYSIASIYVNGSALGEADSFLNLQGSANAIGSTHTACTTTTLSAGDTVEAYAYLKDENGGQGDVYSSKTIFGGYRLIGV